MQVFQNIQDLKGVLQEARQDRLKIGFVPTMGALHPGHISLIEEARKNCDLVVCSIFVNPTQFNDPKDLERYPRTLEKDYQMLEEASCDCVFSPSVTEIYPEKDNRKFDFGRLDQLLEGKHRPGHFNGVAQVVSRLFDIVEPDMAFFGQKDYQQLMIVRAMVKQLGYKVQIVSCPIMREPDGLAMSSRNALLSPEERKAASLLPECMHRVKTLFGRKTIEEIKAEVREMIRKEPLLRYEYLEICNTETLEPYDGNGKAVALIAVYAGNIRLIDNLEL
ncbi:MAG: pantoate--beta-alanine ligase [Bacteroidia bacterium]